MRRFHVRKPLVQWAVLLASGALIAAGAFACSGDDSPAKPGDVDAGVDATSLEDAPSASDAASDGGGSADADAACEGFVCGSSCVLEGDPSFGCSKWNSCRACPGLANAESTCKGELCDFTCDQNFANCNAAAVDGCEVDLTSDRKNCGTCGKACPDSGTPVCADGTCVPSCPAGLKYCTSGCANLKTSPSNCGACDNKCPTPVKGNGTPICDGGACAFRCATGYADCNVDLTDGCETYVRGNDVNHCGSCKPCPATAANAKTVACQSGKCRASCLAGFADCDLQIANGCECNLTNHNCSGSACVACLPLGSSCSSDVDCCGSTGGTAYCALDVDGNPTFCTSR